MQHVIVAGTKRLCRICMADDPKHPVDLYDVTTFGQLSLHEMLQTICAPVFAKSGQEDVMPEMPTQVCPACQDAIVAAYNLHQQCIETDRRLGELLALMWELQEPGGKVFVEEGEDRTASSSTEETVQGEPLVMNVDTENEIPKGDKTCLECGKTFATRWTLIRHIKEDWCDKTNDQNQRTCDICNKVLKSVQLLKRHREMHDDPSSPPELTVAAQEHASNETIDNMEMLKVEALDLMDEHENEDSLLEEVQNQYTECSTCGISFSSARAYRMHTQEANCQRTKTYPCKICGKVFDKASRRQYHMYSHRERVACTRCDETFKNKNGLMAHIRRKRCPANKLGTTQFVPEAEVEEREHPNEQDQLQVEEDGAEVETNDSLDGATQVSEADSSAEKTDTVDIKCTDCGVSFLSARTHKEHTQEGNCQQKPTFPCKICGKIFDKLTRMAYHYYTHKERIPCPMCNETFRCEGSLQKHLNRKNSSGEKVPCSSQMPEDGLNEPLIDQALVSSSEAFRDPLLSDALQVVKVEELEIEETKLASEIIVEQIVVTDARKTCKICSETFERMATFRFHMRRNHKLYVCGKCNEMFESEPVLANHRKTNHAVVTVNCLKCDKSFESQRALQRHRKDGSCLQAAEQMPKPFPCDLCEKSFDSAVKLGYHKVNHGNRIYCDKCGKCLKSKSVLQAHIANGKCLGDKARTCLVCKRVFETLVEYKKHRQEAHSGPVDCPDCGRKLTTFDSLYAHVKDGRCENIRRRSAPGVFGRTCKICGEVQASVSQLKTHMKAKHLDKIYPCASCLLHFPTQKKFDAHMEKHKKNLVNICQTCNTSFPTMKALKTHKFTHRSRVTCAICEKDYRCESDLRMHMTIHTGEKPHTCDFCPMRFRTKFKKKYHMRQTHSTEPKEQIPVVCEHCGSMYTSPYSLKTHIKAVHEGIRPHACTQCDLKFARSRQLSRHKLTHTKERPFKCVVCPQAYAECSELVKHVAREHGDGNAYACDRCDKSFRFIAELRKHYVEHAQEGFDSAGAQEVRFNSLALLNMRFAKEKQQQRAQEGEDSE